MTQSESNVGRIEHRDLRRFVAWIRDRKVDAGDVAKVLAKLELLRVNGTTWGAPHVRHLGGELWELKVRGAQNTYRVYFIPRGEAVICLEYGTKGTQESDIARAQGYCT